LSVTVLGHVADGEPWLRSGARPGDRLVVSGPLGGSGTARHLSVRPRSDLVSQLRATRAIVHAAMDLSDGLGRDLPRLCEASSVGARIDVACLPIHADVEAHRDATAAALGDGEDFELLLALPADVARPDGLIDIGEVVATPDMVLVRNGHDEPWPSTGFEHGF
jgi:thiamine-monophosphate kinase